MGVRTRLQIGTELGVGTLSLASAAWAHEGASASARFGARAVAGVAFQAMGAGEPLAWADAWHVLPAVYVVTAALVSRALIVRECYAGRFTEVPRSKLPPALSPAEAGRAQREERMVWIGEHLAGIQPEVAGAIFHAGVGAPEVAALLARFEAEGLLAPAASTPGRAAEWQLIVARDTLAEHERALTDAIFFDGVTTSMSRIAAHYRKRGFSAADVLRAPLEQRAIGMDGLAPRNRGASCLLAFAAFGVVVVLNFSLFRSIVAEQQHDHHWLGGATALASLGCLLIGLRLARSFREDFVTPHRSWFILRAFLGAFIACFAYLLIEATALSPTAAVLSFVLAMLLTGWVSWTWWWRASPGVVATRRRVGIARCLMEAQVADDVRMLEPRWRPHLIALDLMPADGCWLRDVEAPPPAVTAIVHPTRVTISSSSGHSSNGRGSRSFSGGGGSFGGGGASGSW